VNWMHFVGLYIAIGSVLMGLGILVKIGYGGKKVKGIPFAIGLVIGVLLWPFILIVLGIIWKTRRKTHKVERFIGYCAHATLWEPYCAQCRRDIKREKDTERELWVLQREIAMHTAMDLEIDEVVEKYIQENPKCIKCGIAGRLSRYKDSVWIICGACGRKVFVPDPSVPESIDGPPGVAS